MAVGTFRYQNSSGYSEQIQNPEEYRTYNIEITRGSVENNTNATARMYTEEDGRGNSDYLNPGNSRYITTSYRSCVFTT
ncbi:hypothetical protein K8O92_27295 [Nocardia asteroides]|nr:hypothetical protein K8O92_27295 [Nocardia asteroides]